MQAYGTCWAPVWKWSWTEPGTMITIAGQKKSLDTPHSTGPARLVETRRRCRLQQ